MWNAKRRIKTSIGLTQEQFQRYKSTPILQWVNEHLKDGLDPNAPIKKYFLENPEVTTTLNAKKGQWWRLEKEHAERFMDLHPELRRLSRDVKSFITANPHLREGDILYLIRRPASYFSAPGRVPLASRKQVYL